MKAVILTAGEGTRLRPLTGVRPKPMLPVANRPLLEHVVEAVVEAGIEEIVLVVGYKRERIQSYFRDGDDWDVDIEYAVQEKQLGTGHALLQAAPLVDSPFIALNGDRVIEPDAITRLVADWDGGEEPTITVTRSGAPTNYGVVGLDGDRVTSVREKPPEHEVETDLINAGVYGLTDDVFDRLNQSRSAGEIGLTTALQSYADEGELRAVRFSGLWLDVSHLWDLLSVNARLLDRSDSGETHGAVVHESAAVADSVLLGDDARIRPGAVVLPGTAVGSNVEIGANAVVSGSVLFPDATVEAGSVVHDCVVGENARIGANTTAEGGRETVIVNETLHTDVRLGGVIGDNADVGGAVTIAPGAVLGTGVEVESGATVEGQTPDGVHIRVG